MLYVQHKIFIFTVSTLCFTKPSWQFLAICNLALEPSVTQVAQRYSRRLPALERFHQETKLSLLKSTYLTWNLKTNKVHSFGSPEFTNQNLRQISPGVPELWSDKQIKQRLQLNIYNYSLATKSLTLSLKVFV